MTDKKRTVIFMNLLIISIASSFLSTALSAALPPIIKEYGVDATTGQWLTSAYSLVMGIITPLTAYLITRFKTKKLYLSAIVLMVLGLATSVLAKSFPVMMVGRVLQACSNGITSAMAQVVILSIYPAEKKGTIMGWYGLSVGAAPIIAPTIGGIFIDTVGWRMIFLFTMFLMLIGFIWTIFSFDDVLETQKKSFDIYSFILSAIAFGGITFGIGNARKGINDPMVILPLALGIIGLVLFSTRQLKQSSPFLDLRVFQSRNFTISVLSLLLFYCGMMGSSILIPIYVQSVVGKSATISGLVTLPGSLCMALASPYAGKLYDRFGMKKLAIFASIMLTFSYFGMVFTQLSTSLLIPAFLHIVRCLGIASMMMPFITWGVTSVTKDKAADANAVINTTRSIGGAIGQAVFVNIMSAVTAAAALSHPLEAGMRGVHTAFAIMGILAVLQFFFTLCFIPAKKKN